MICAYQESLRVPGLLMADLILQLESTTDPKQGSSTLLGRDATGRDATEWKA